MKTRALDEPEALTLDCTGCGRRAGLLLRHYEKYQCVCNRWYWALRPKQGGPLAVYPWPGALREEVTPNDYQQEPTTNEEL